MDFIKKRLHQFSLKKALKPMRLTWWILYGPLFWRIMSPWSYKISRITARLIFFVFGDAWNFWKLLETFGKFHGNFRKLLSNLLETETSNLYPQRTPLIARRNWSSWRAKVIILMLRAHHFTINGTLRNCVYPLAWVVTR